MENFFFSARRLSSLSETHSRRGSRFATSSSSTSRRPSYLPSGDAGLLTLPPSMSASFLSPTSPLTPLSVGTTESTVVTPITPLTPDLMKKLPPYQIPDVFYLDLVNECSRGMFSNNYNFNFLNNHLSQVKYARAPNKPNCFIDCFGSTVDGHSIGYNIDDFK